MSAVTVLAYRWNEFCELEISDENGRVFNKNSKLIDTLENIKALLNDFYKTLSQTLNMKCSNSMNAFAISQTYLKRAEFVKNTMLLIGNINEALSKELFRRLCKRINQQKQIIDKDFQCNKLELLTFICENDTHKQWSDVFDDIVRFQNSGEKLCIPITELKNIAILIAENIATRMSELKIPPSDELIKFLIQMLSVTYASHDSRDSFINLHEFLYMPGMLDMMLFPYKTDDTDDDRDKQEP